MHSYEDGGTSRPIPIQTFDYLNKTLDDYWICPRCVHYAGGCKCGKNVFICYTMADMSGCWAFKEGVKCMHCGRVTPNE